MPKRRRALNFLVVGRHARWWLALAGAAFVGNAVWEVAQRPLYEHPGTIWHCLRAAAGDVAWTISAGRDSNPSGA